MCSIHGYSNSREILLTSALIRNGRGVTAVDEELQLTGAVTPLYRGRGLG
jgi:hypothetical protein